jgi:hypothetical protein
MKEEEDGKKVKGVSVKEAEAFVTRDKEGPAFA